MKLLADGYLLRHDGVIEINPDVVYPRLMAELGIEESQLDRYHLTIVYECAKRDAIRLVEGTPADRRNQGIALQLNILPGRAKQRWQLKRHPEGKGHALGLRHARDHFKHLRKSPH